MKPSLAYRPDIDGLRAVAVLLVIAFHAFPKGLRSGFIGVDVFFVISGYLITGIIVERLGRDTFSFREFYARRIRRIFPALITVLLATAAMGCLILPPDQLKQLFKHVLAGAFFASNFILMGESGYFDAAAEEKPLLHLWSLGVEEQFYLAWPLLLVVAWRLKIRPAWLAAAGGAASFLYGMYQGVVLLDTSSAFYLPHARFWEMMAGAWLACNAGGAGKPSAGMANLRAWTGSALLAGGAVFISADSLETGAWALLPTLGTALLIAAGPDAWLNRRVLANPVLVGIGLISYPLYLWHWPLLTMARLSLNEPAPWWLLLAAVALSFALAWLTYRCIETRLRWRPRATAGLAAATFGLGGLSFAAGANMEYLMFERQWTDPAHRAVMAQFTGAVGPYSMNQACLDRYPFPQARTYGWWFCIQSKPSDPTILLLGNSYANQMYSGLAANPDLRGHTILSVGACDASGYPEEARASNHPCAGRRKQDNQDYIDGILRASPSIRHVIIDGLRRVPGDDYIASLKGRIDFLEAQGVRVIVFKPHLYPGFHLRACYPNRTGRPPRDCSFDPAEARKIAADFEPLVRAIGKSNPKVLFFDQNALYCQEREGGCSFLRQGLPLNRDQVHLSEFAAARLAENFVAWARLNAPELAGPGE